MDLVSFYFATSEPLLTSNENANCLDYGLFTSYTDAAFSDKFLGPDHAASQLKWSATLAYKKAGAGCYFFVIFFVVLLLGLGIASISVVIHKLCNGRAKQPDVMNQNHVVCCGCGGGGGWLGDPCTTVALTAITFGLTMPVALIAWPTTMGLLMSSYITGYSAIGNSQVMYPNEYTLLTGYSVTCFACFFNLAGMIISIVSRDAYRAHAGSSRRLHGIDVIDLTIQQPATTVIVLPPQGMSAIGYNTIDSGIDGAPISSPPALANILAPQFNQLGVHDVNMNNYVIPQACGAFLPPIPFHLKHQQYPQHSIQQDPVRSLSM